jgi:hypothetical protein
MRFDSQRVAALQQERRRSSPQSGAPAADATQAAGATAQGRRRAASTCGWCGGPIAVRATGRLPKWCSPSCRQRAWEQTRAAASGWSAVQIVERRVEMPVPIPPTRGDWPRLLGELVTQLDTGRIYNRDLDELSAALTAISASMTRRLYIRSRTASYPH